MSEWKPIETAPLRTPVMLGWWENSVKEGGLAWRQGPGEVKRRIFCRGYTGVMFGRGLATHWRPLPTPPKGQD